MKLGRRDVVKIVPDIVDKKPQLRGTRPSRHFADRAQNFLNIVAVWSVHVCQIWSGLVGVCFFGSPQSHYDKASMAFSLEKHNTLNVSKISNFIWQQFLIFNYF